MSVDVPSPGLIPVPSRLGQLDDAREKAVVPGELPNPRIPLPTVAVPTVALFAGGLVVWAAATWLYYADLAPLWLTIAMHATVTFTMFTVVHESEHHAAGRLTWVNEVLGRLAIPFVSVYASFPLLRYAHIEHHRNTNEDAHHDPSTWTTNGPWWQLPFRWLTVDVWFGRFYASRLHRRPQAELVESAVVLGVKLSATVALVSSGYGWDVLAVYLIPQRIGLGLLSWWFDWLPHHGLGPTARRDRFGTTRVRVGLEWLMTPLMLCQNYHLVHHLHPSIPFYRYSKAWRDNREAYLAQAVPIATAWGRELSASEYRDWRQLTQNLATAPKRSPEPRRQARFQQLRIDEVRELTADSVEVSFDVPERLAEVFRFTAGQHLVVRATLNGKEVRRTYSISSPADSGEMRIAVKKREGGLFSAHIASLRPGDALDVLPPSGAFTLVPDTERATHHYVAIAAGAGITPIMSILQTALAADENSRVTLLYVNRLGVSTMFADELTALSRQFDGRLHLVHFRTDEQDPDLHKTKPARLDPIGEALAISHERYQRGRLDGRRLRAMLQNRLHPAKVDDWFICGPEDLVTTVRKTLTDHDVSPQAVHYELFHVDTPELGTGTASRITVELEGSRTATSTADETVLDAARRSGIDMPYGCAAGACGTCRARLTEGAVTMDVNHALSDADVARGYVLPCQARPTTPEVTVTYTP
jgi:ferredoxin-NADP reductase/fatty acid desaturase